MSEVNRMENIVNTTLPKYSKYQLIDMIKEKDCGLLSKDELILYNQIISGVVLKPKHYQLISKILNLPAEKLLEKEKETDFEKIYYRTNSEIEREDIESVIKIFRIYTEQRKIRGNI